VLPHSFGSPLSIPRYFRGEPSLATPMSLLRECKFSFVALIFLLFLVPVDAVHGQPPHVRRSLAFKGIHQRRDIGAALTGDVPSALSNLLNGAHSSSGEPS
jgi:hypothetical protein